MTKSRKHCGKRRNLSFGAISSLVTMFFEKPSAAEASESVYTRERVKFLYALLQTLHKRRGPGDNNSTSLVDGID